MNDLKKAEPRFERFFSKLPTPSPRRQYYRHSAHGKLIQKHSGFRYRAGNGLHFIMPSHPSALQRSRVPELHLGPDELPLRARGPVLGAGTTVPAVAEKPEAGSQLRHAQRARRAALRELPGWQGGRAEGGDRVRHHPFRQKIRTRRRRLGDCQPHLVGYRESDQAAVAAKRVEQPPSRSS